MQYVLLYTLLGWTTGLQNSELVFKKLHFVLESVDQVNSPLHVKLIKSLPNPGMLAYVTNGLIP